MGDRDTAGNDDWIVAFLMMIFIGSALDNTVMGEMHSSLGAWYDSSGRLHFGQRLLYPAFLVLLGCLAALGWRVYRLVRYWSWSATMPASKDSFWREGFLPVIVCGVAWAALQYLVAYGLSIAFGVGAGADALLVLSMLATGAATVYALGKWYDARRRATLERTRGAHALAVEALMAVVDRAATSRFDWSKKAALPPAPKLDEVVESLAKHDMEVDRGALAAATARIGQPSPWPLAHVMLDAGDPDPNLAAQEWARKRVAEQLESLSRLERLDMAVLLICATEHGSRVLAEDGLAKVRELTARPDLGTRGHVQASLAKLRKRGLVAIEGQPTAVRLPTGLDGALRELVWHARVRGAAS